MRNESYEDTIREQDEKRAEGYECQKCGYVPTWKEAHRGSCPQCRIVPKHIDTKREEDAEKVRSS